MIRSRNQQILRIVLLVAMVVLTGSAGYYVLFRGEYGFLKCLYMTVISLTTVGYGEVLDVSAHKGATVYTMLLILLGMGILVYAASTFTAFIVEGHFSGLWRKRIMENKIKKLKRHYIVCGMGETGLRVVEELLKNLNQVVVIDRDGERLSLLDDPGSSLFQSNSTDSRAVFYLEGDATDDHTLEAAGIRRANGIVAVLPSDKDNLIVTMSARMMNPDIRIVSKFIDNSIEPKLRKLGADSVVSPNLIGGLRIASEMIRPSAVDFLDKMIRSSQGTYRIEEIRITERSKFAGKKLSECSFGEKYGILVLALERERRAPMEFNPEPSVTLEPEMTLVVLGEIENIRKAREV